MNFEGAIKAQDGGWGDALGERTTAMLGRAIGMSAVVCVSCVAESASGYAVLEKGL